MPIARGIKTSLQMWDETTYGVDPGSINAETMNFVTFAPSGSLERLMDDTISGRRGAAASIVGNKDLTGQIATKLAPESCLRYLHHLVGAVATTGAGPYSHLFSLAQDLPVGFGMQLDYGSAIAAPGRFLHMKGCRIAKGSFKFPSSGFVEALYDVRGADFNLTDVALADATPGAYGHTGFSMFSATITEGGSPIATATEVGLEWDNDLDDSLFVIGGGGVRGDLPEGFAKIKGSGTFLFKDVTLLNKGLNSTTSSLVLTLQHGTGAGSVGNEKITFSIPNLKWDVKTPTVDGPKGLKVQLNWMSERVGSAEDASSITVLSSRIAL